MKRNVILALIILLLATSPVFSSGSAESSEADDTTSKFELVVAFDAVDSVSWAKGIRRFAEIAEEKSNGRLTFKIYSGGQMGSQKQVLENMQLGAIHMTYTFEPLSVWVPEIDAYSFLYMFKDIDHLRRVDNGPVGIELKQLVVDKAGFRPIMSFVREARQLTMNKPVYSIDDVVGKKIRVTQSSAIIQSWEAIGARPVPMAMGEVFSALQQGVIDGQENPLSVIYARKVYEANKYVAMTNHQYSLVWVLINEDTFQALPKDLQKVVLDAAKEAEVFEHEIAKQEWAAMQATLESNGVVFTQPDVTGFREATKDVYKSFPELARFVEKIYATE
jgi:tripartite ATP-independent transporter DctP family solute receptor